MIANNKSPKVFFLILSSFILVQACSKPGSKKIEKFFNVDSNQKKTKSSFISDNSGKGLQSRIRLQAESHLLNYKDPLHINVQGQFLSEESDLIVNAYTRDLTKTDGTKIELKPKGKSLEIYVFTKDFPEFHYCTIADAVASDGGFSVNIQWAYMRSMGPSLLVWNRYYSGKTQGKKSYEFFNALNADCSNFNNRSNQVFMDYFGSGALWGIELYYTRLKKVKRIEAYGI